MFIKRNNVLVAFLLSSFIVLFALIACSSNSNNGASRDKKQDWLSKLSLAPDGKRAVFERSFRNEPVKIYEYFVESGELKSFNPPDNQSWLMPCYSNNGKSIVFVAAAKNGKDLDLTNMHIAIMDTNGENFMQLTNESGTRIHPSFSHSGEKIVYAKASTIRKGSARTPAADYDIFELDIKTKKEVKLTDFKFWTVSPPYYLPGDRKVIFHGEWPRNYPEVTSSDKEAYQRRHDEENRSGPYIYVWDIETQYLKTLLSQASEPMVTESGEIFFLLTSVYNSEVQQIGRQAYHYYQDGSKERITNTKSTTVWSASISRNGSVIGLIYDIEPNRQDRKIAIYDVKMKEGKTIQLPDQPTQIIEATKVLTDKTK